MGDHIAVLISSATVRNLFLTVGLLAGVSAAAAADYPAPKEATWVAKDFRFHTGETLPDLRIAYTTVGDPSGAPVLLLHGSMHRRRIF